MPPDEIRRFDGTVEVRELLLSRSDFTDRGSELPFREDETQISGS
jgi:hypothetical protein